MGLHIKVFLGYVAVTAVALWWLCRCHDRREKKTMNEFWEEKNRRRRAVSCLVKDCPHCGAKEGQPCKDMLLCSAPLAASSADEENR